MPFCQGPMARSRGFCSARKRRRGERTRSSPASLPALLPPGTYRFANAPHDARLAALGFALGAYRFVRYGKPATGLRLELPDWIDGAELSRLVEAVYLARDLINTPANDCGPGELAQAAGALAGRHGADIRTIVGDDLIEEFPADPCGRTCGSAGAPAYRHELGRSGGAQSHAGWQRRMLRQRRSRHQVGQRHVADEEGHGRRRERARARPFDHGPQARPAAAGPDSGGRERHFGRRVPAARRGPLAQRTLCRGRQYRRRRPAHPRRCVGARRRGGTRASHRPRHADRRRAGRPRPRSAALLYGR